MDPASTDSQAAAATPVPWWKRRDPRAKLWLSLAFLGSYTVQLAWWTLRGGRKAFPEFGWLLAWAVFSFGALTVLMFLRVRRSEMVVCAAQQRET